MIRYSVFLNGCLPNKGKNQLKIDAAQQQRDRPAIFAAIRRTQISAKKKGPPFSSPKLLEGTAPHMTTVQPQLRAFMALHTLTYVKDACANLACPTAPAAWRYSPQFAAPGPNKLPFCASLSKNQL